MKCDRREFLKLSGLGSFGLFLSSITPKVMAQMAENENGIPKMIYRPYGKTGKNISLLGFGGMRFNSDKVKNGNYEDVIKLLTESYKKGINYYDSAPLYVDKKSENIMGLAFKEFDKMQKNGETNLPYYFTTKSGIEDDPTSDSVRKRIDKSLKEFGKDKINFFHMWYIMNKDHYKAVMAPGGPYEGALAAKKEGLIDHIVFSTHAKSEENIEIINDDVFEGMLIGYNIINFPKGEKAVEHATKKGIGIAIMNPIAGGLIPSHQEYFKRLMDKSNSQISLVQTALAFLMGHKGVSTILSGMQNLNHLEENFNTLKYARIFEDLELNEIKKKYLQRIDEICTGCHYCNKCKYQIPVPEIMDIYNYYILDGKEAAKKRIDKLYVVRNGQDVKIDLKEELKKCDACLDCVKACTQHLPILGRYKTIKKELLS